MKKKKSQEIKDYNPVQVENALRSILADVARVNESVVRKDINIRDRLGIDSLNAMEILAAIEAKFGIKVDEAKAFDVVTVEDLYELIKGYMNEHITLDIRDVKGDKRNFQTRSL